MISLNESKEKVALVIATYNWPQALQLLLESILVQDIFPHEVIIADDGSDESTKKLIDSFRPRFKIPLIHLWQEDNGFQKTIILNRAIAETTCDYIIQVDGDIILHRNFIRDHISVAEKGCYIRGSRVLMLEEKTTRLLKSGFKKVSFFTSGIKNRINSIRSPFLSHFFIKKKFISRNFRGCNCAFWKADFIKVNGYNNEFEGWGHEDIELAARFTNIGLRQKKVKLMAVCYHLHHEYADMQREPVNFKIYQYTLNKGIRYCSKGYNACHKQYS